MALIILSHQIVRWHDTLLKRTEKIAVSLRIPCAGFPFAQAFAWSRRCFLFLPPNLSFFLRLARPNPPCGRQPGEPQPVAVRLQPPDARCGSCRRPRSTCRLPPLLPDALRQTASACRHPHLRPDALRLSSSTPAGCIPTPYAGRPPTELWANWISGVNWLKNWTSGEADGLSSTMPNCYTATMLQKTILPWKFLSDWRSLWSNPKVWNNESESVKLNA